MRFKRILVENFGPFKMPTMIDFKNRDGVSIVWGFNGRGKTTFLNAFSFVLTGIVKDRDGKLNNYLSFVNEAGKNDGRYTFRVVLDLQDRGSNYRIIRSLQLMPGVSIPNSTEDVFVDLKVNKDGNILSPADSGHFVRGIMSPDVSRFFLFDGELLSQYEELLDMSSTTGGSIKNSIEQILGMPILTFGAIDAKEAAATIATAARKVAQNEQAVSKYTKMLDCELENLKYQDSELQRLRAERDDLLSKKAKLQNLVDDTQKMREIISRKRGIEAAMEAQETISKSEQQEIAGLLTDAWKWMVLPTVVKQNAQVQVEIDTLIDKEKTSKSQEVVISYIRQAIQDSFCPICEHGVDFEEKNKLEKRLDTIAQQSGGLSSDERARLSGLRTRSEAFAMYLGTNDRSAEIIRRYNNYVTAKVKYTDLKEHDLKDAEDDLASLKKNATGADEKKAIEYYEELGRVSAEIKTYDAGIVDLEQKIEEIKQNIKKLNSTILSKSQNKDVTLANKKVAFADSIADIFTEGIAVYRDKLSKDVERDATELFLAMNTEEDYGGLAINQNYGLSIIRKSNGQPVQKPSAGWEHMVAFALIGALHKNAPFDGPVIMDSPFYRLDNRNTASMVRALPLIAHQVLIFPYPGEINPDTTRSDIGANIIQELEISRISSNESSIKEASENG